MQLQTCAFMSKRRFSHKVSKKPKNGRRNSAHSVWTQFLRTRVLQCGITFLRRVRPAIQWWLGKNTKHLRFRGPFLPCRAALLFHGLPWNVAWLTFFRSDKHCFFTSRTLSLLVATWNEWIKAKNNSQKQKKTISGKQIVIWDMCFRAFRFWLLYVLVCTSAQVTQSLRLVCCRSARTGTCWGVRSSARSRCVCTCLGCRNCDLASTTRSSSRALDVSLGLIFWPRGSKHSGRCESPCRLLFIRVSLSWLDTLPPPLRSTAHLSIRCYSCVDHLVQCPCQILLVCFASL